MAAGLARASTQENVSTSLSAGITDVATTMTVGDASALQSPCYLVIDRVDAAGTLKTTSLWEYVKVTNIAGNILTIIRAQGGSTGQSHSSGAIVEAVMTAKLMEEYFAALDPEHTSSGAHTTDTISEKTVAAGVTVDGLQIKDGVGVYTDKAPNINVKARAYLSASQLDLVHGTATKVGLDAETYDIGSDFADGKFTAPVNGYYLVTGQIRFTGVVANKSYISEIRVNGLTRLQTSYHASLSTHLSAVFSDIIYLDADDYIELFAISNADVDTVDILGGTNYTFMTVHLLSV